MIRTVWVVLSPKIQDLMPIISIFLLLYFTVVLLSEMVPFLISVPISNWKFPCYGHFSNNGWIWLSKLIQLGMHIKWNFWEDCKWKWNIEKCSLWLWFQICDNFSFFQKNYMWNTVTIQYNPLIEEEWDEHFKVTCEYGYDFWKTVTFPFLDVE